MPGSPGLLLAREYPSTEERQPRGPADRTLTASALVCCLVPHLVWKSGWENRGVRLWALLLCLIGKDQ